MATFTIDKINYVIGGDTEKIINVDLRNSDDEVYLNKSFVTDEYTELNTDLSAEQNTHRLYADNREEEIPLSATFHALFDFKDVAVKSDFYKADNTAVFGPKLSNDPLGFAQGIKGNAYGATLPERESSIIAFTNLADTRERRLDGKSNSTIWHYKLSSPGDLTYTYLELYNMTYLKKYWDPISGTSISATHVDSIEEWLIEKFGDLSSTIGMEELLNPKYNNTGMERMFLYHMLVSNKKSNSSKWNEFNLGNIFGNVFVGKNFYDSKYSTDLSSAGDNALSCPIRNYVKIGTTGGWPFLTYYDNKKFTISTNDTTETDYNRTIRTGIVENNNSGRKYQHVETVNSLNRFMNRANHKSNMYSIRLNLDLNKLKNEYLNEHENEANKMEELLRTVKLDIKNSIRRITSNLAPAHTQLFKVYIDGE